MILVVGIVLMGIFLLIVVGRPRSYGVGLPPAPGTRGQGRTYRSKPGGPVWGRPEEPLIGASSTWRCEPRPHKPSRSYGGHNKYGGGIKYGGAGKKHGGGAKSKW